MSTKVFVIYNLKEGVDVEEYKRWSREVDQPTTSNMPGCHSFVVYLVRGEASGKTFPMVVEDIDVESWESWQETLKSEAFSQVMEEWPLYGVGKSAITVYCEKI